MSDPSTLSCHVCGQPGLTEVPEFTPLRRVTSDCKPWPAGGRLGVCTACATVQKVIDDPWKAEIAAIYRDYTIYQQSGGVEQQVFTSGGGQAMSRSLGIVTRLRDEVGLPDSGRLLDVGCGNGAMLRSFARLFPNWKLVGNEWDDKYRSVVEAIPGVEGLFTGRAESTPGEFDAITLLHVLEHVPEPAAFLSKLKSKLRPGGLLLVDVPDHRRNPFDLLIADHCGHFVPATLENVFARAGLEVAASADSWAPKELTVVGRAAASPLLRTVDGSAALHHVRQQIAWLHRLVAAGRDLAARRTLGLFGTSIAGGWLFGELGERVAFFVDEDPHRIGKSWLGRPIVAPDATPADAAVLIGLPELVAAGIKRRLDDRGLGRCFHLPPPMADAARAAA